MKWDSIEESLNIEVESVSLDQIKDASLGNRHSINTSNTHIRTGNTIGVNNRINYSDVIGSPSTRQSSLNSFFD